MKKVFLFCIFFTFFVVAQSQNVIIKGTIDKAENKKVRLSVYNDLISMYERPLSEVLVKTPTDTFQFQMSINYPTIVVLRIETYTQEFFVEPNRTYNITIPEFDWSLDEKINIYTNPVALPVVFENLENNDLNLLINNFDSVYASFLKTYNYRILVEQDKTLLDTIKTLLSERYDTIRNDYFIQYKKYKLATIELAIRLKSNQTFAKEYFEGQPILYRHAGYMDYFNIFFESSFVDGTKQIKKERLAAWVNDGDLFKILDSLGVEPMLKNEQFRELVFLKGMKDAYHHRGYNPKAITELLQKYILQTKFVEYKPVAQGIIDQHEEFLQGAESKNFTLPDIDKNMTTLDMYKGEWIYLSFVRLREQPSLRELASMAYYHDTITQKYNIRFITISCDREFQVMYHFLKNSKDGEKYNWTWLHFNNNYDLLDTYKVRIYPFFVLINPEGKIASYPAKSPEEGFFLLLDYIEKRLLNEKPEE